ncbi:MAG: hypothetical protein JMDDDDMK_05636 [Acidobacteria bacterium]|nr:hypothetical protein [Acidobacteriota bacterium]
MQQKLNANSGLREMDFGSAVALDGDTALIGAQSFSTNANFIPGAVYVFTRSGASWTQQAQLFASDIGNFDRFGAAVALEGDTALIGASGNAVTQLGQGSAYVFTRNGATWKEQKILTANDASANDNFGNAVALSGDTAAIGAHKYGGDDRGKVYTFKRGATGWAQTDGVEAPDPLAGAYFGASVALDGDRMIVGAAPALYGNARAERSAYAFVRNGGWRPVRQFGAEVGSAYDLFGYAVALDGATALVGAPRGDAAATDQGAAYVFALRDSQHSEQQKLTASDGKENDQFGAVVALDGDTLAVGAPLWDAGGNQDMGAVYVFTRNGAVWTFQQRLNGVRGNDRFGQAVALSGDTLVVGAPRTDYSAGADQGAVFVYARNGATWTFRQVILAGDAAPYDYFGAAVALDGNTILIGAPFDDVEFSDDGLARDQGSAYVYTRDGAGLWTPHSRLFTNTSHSDEWFGSAVALDGDTAAVGAPRDELVNYRSEEGLVYVFTRIFGSWTPHKQFTANDTTGRDHFGSALAISGDILMVGAPDGGFTPPPSPFAGAVYAFTRSPEGWTQRQKITANDKAENALFGAAIAFNGDRLVVGAPGTNNGANARVGAAYVFTGSGGTQPLWTQQQKLTASAGSTIQYFGGGVALSDETVAVAAPYDAVGGTFNQGSVYIFASPVCQNVTLAPAALPNAALNAAYSQALTASGSGVGAYLFSVSEGALPPGLSLDQAGLLAGTPTATGAYRFTISATQPDTLCVGKRDYTIKVTPPCPALTLAPATLPNGKRNSPFNQTLTTSGGAAPYRYTVTTGALPPGINLSASGALSGTPTEVGAYNFTVVATDANGCTATRDYALTINTEVVTVVSAASYKPGVAPESIAAAFGLDLATQTEAAAQVPLPTELGGARVTIRDSQGAEWPAPLFFVSPGQINFQVPQNAALGAATVRLSGGATGQFEITRIAPALFSVNGDGKGLAAAYALHVDQNGGQRIEPVARFDGTRFVPVPIEIGPLPEQVYLVVFGTGFRRRQLVTANIGGQFTNVLYAGAASGLVGVDQANVLLPRSLIGSGEVTLSFSVDGVYANYVRIHVR